MLALYVAGAIFVLLLLIVFIRALLFVPKRKGDAREPSLVSVDGYSAAQSLSEMIRCKTVSCADRSLEDSLEFEKFRKLLPKLFPLVFEKCEYEEPSDRSVLLRLRGEDSASPTVIMAHYDVVSVADEGWDKPAFDGVIEDGFLWGRGTIDTKVTLNAVLFATESLLKKGFIPKRDIYFAFGGDEEINGYGAKSIVDFFAKHQIKPGLVLDEGGAVVQNVFPGVKARCALVGTAEKGMANIEYTVASGGGHSSAPTKNTPIERLSRVCVKLSKNPFKFRITPPARKMFDTLARYSAFVYRLIFANLWLFAPVLNLITKKNGGELDAILRTTVVFTKMQGAEGMNVIPPVATMISNHRILPGESVESTVDCIKRTLKDESVSIRVIGGMNPSRVSSAEGEAWDLLSGAISDTWSDAIVSPYLMLACSDSRHYGEICDRVYRFSPLALSGKERETIHGNNERITISQIEKSVEFYLRFIEKL